jgi:hypothetical protein
MKIISQEGNSIGLGDNAGFFLDKGRRIAAPNYISTDENILKTGMRTTSVASLNFLIEQVKTELVDVGDGYPHDHGDLCFLSWEFGCDHRSHWCRMTVPRPGTSKRSQRLDFPFDAAGLEIGPEEEKWRFTHRAAAECAARTNPISGPGWLDCVDLATRVNLSRRRC